MRQKEKKVGINIRSLQEFETAPSLFKEMLFLIVLGLNDKTKFCHDLPVLSSIVDQLLLRSVVCELMRGEVSQLQKV